MGNLKKEWLEKTDRPMETMLPEIAATLLTAGPLLKDQARRRAEEAERHAIEQRRREEERRLQKENRNRVRRLVEISGAWRELQIAREFLEVLTQGSHDPEEIIGGRTIREWLDWAKKQLDREDPVNRGVDAVFGDISRITSWTYPD